MTTPIPPFELDPERPAQSSGVADVQVVEKLAECLAAVWVIRNGQQALEASYAELRGDLATAMREQAGIYQAANERCLQDLYNRLHASLMRHQNDTRVEQRRLHDRVDSAFAEIDKTKANVAAVDARVGQALADGSPIMVDPELLEERAEVWLDTKLRPFVRRFLLAFTLFALLELVQWWYLATH